MQVRVHNISNRHYVHCQPMCVTIGGIKIRPGKSDLVPAESINTKTERLHGSLIWIGSLPSSLKKPAEPPQQKLGLSMDPEQVRSYLSNLNKEELISLSKNVTPSLGLLESTVTRRYVFAIASACFSEEYTLSPDAFYWLGRWSKQPNGDYIEV